MRVTVVATGKVQGVGYRHFVEVCARKLGLHGQVQNMPDGSVHMIAEGSPAALDDFIRHIWARGQEYIQVENLQVMPGEATGEFRGFWVRW
ncbi:MAG TPA: acylphosphatase [Methanoregula sp.]|nr:acylphosphatase [Methanoregula sp.]